jgi:hypothetical protein
MPTRLFVIFVGGRLLTPIMKGVGFHCEKTNRKLKSVNGLMIDAGEGKKSKQSSLVGQ